MGRSLSAYQGLESYTFCSGVSYHLRLESPHIDTYRGHHGVKPENIVVLSHGSDSPANWQFKFADFGLNNSRGKVLQDGEAAANEMQHASTYGM